MLALLREHEFVRVADLSRTFGISEVTVRSDLSTLADSGLIQRVHGGAMVPGSEVERSFEESLDASAQEKAAIGHHAARTVRPGETIMLDVGTSTAALARSLVGRETLHNVTVFTSSLKVALDLEPAIPRITVVVTGGTLRPLQHSLVDPMAGYVFDTVRFDRAFVGCNGVHVDHGVTNVNLPEAGMKRRMIAAAEQTVVVADGSKVGNVSVAKIAELDEVDLLITGRSARQDLVKELVQHGVAVEIAEPGNPGV